FQAEDGIRDFHVTGVQTCALPILQWSSTDPDGDSLTYRVLLSDNLNNNQIEFEDLVYDTLALNNLHFGATYTWQVIASDGINDEVFSSSSQFTVRQNPEYRYHFVQIENGKIGRASCRERV